MTNRSSLIIDARENQSTVQRWTGWIITLVCWTLWIWLWWPYANDALPLDRLFSAVPLSVPAPPPARGPRLDYLFDQAGLILLAGALLVLWALVHTWRFAGVTRRQRVQPINPEQLARTIGLSTESLEQGRRSQRLIAHHHTEGGLKTLEIGDQGWTPPSNWGDWKAAAPDH